MNVLQKSFVFKTRMMSMISLILLLSFLVPYAGLAKDKIDTELSAWKDGPAKKTITDFVKKVTDEKSADYVKPSERIAVFDNDGTLWCEQPIYTQVVFINDKAKAYATTHPEVQNIPIFKALIDNDTAFLRKAGAKGTMELVTTTYKDITVEQFADAVTKWMDTEKHPRFHQPYTSCVYQPMLEVIAYLQKHGFKNYIVSGGGTEFMRPWTERVYEIPPEQVIGSTGKLQFTNENDVPQIRRLPEIDFVCDASAKPVAIERVIGRRPIAAFGNSNGDLQMLQWTMGGSGKRLAALVHHTDAEREYAYDRDSKIGRLDKALDEANKKGWLVIDMKNDWKQIFEFEKDK
jgi:phosphoglycolate phosphatase-like HAD superfamily hydrolase